MYERSRLAGAGAGHDQQRRVAVGGGLPLLGIQFIQKLFDRKGLRHAMPWHLPGDIMPSADAADKPVDLGNFTEQTDRAVQAAAKTGVSDPKPPLPS